MQLGITHGNDLIQTFRAKTIGRPVVEPLRRKRLKVNEQRKKALKLTVCGDEVERTAAEELCADLRAEANRIEREIKTHGKSSQLQGIDVDSEVEKTVALLSGLGKFTAKIPRARLKELFTLVGAKLTVHFQHPTDGRRKNIPVGAELVLGADGNIELPKEVKNALLNIAGKFPAMLGKHNRGERI